MSKKVEADLRRLGTVERVTGIADPIAGSIAFARFVSKTGTFGWEVTDPGHGLVFVNRARPLDAVAAAPLSGSGTYGPQLLHSGARASTRSSTATSRTSAPATGRTRCAGSTITAGSSETRRRCRVDCRHGPGG